MKNWYAINMANAPLYFMLAGAGTATALGAYYMHDHPSMILIAAFLGGFGFANCLVRAFGTRLTQAAMNNAISFDKWNEKNADAPK